MSGLIITTGLAGVALPAAAAEPADCVAVSDQGLTTGAHLGTFAAVGETHCLAVPTPQGAMLEIWSPAFSALERQLDIDVVDADGTTICGAVCELTGPAPYRVLVTALEPVTNYQLTVQRVDRIAGCAELPLGAFGSVTGALTTFPADRFAGCFAIPADRHASSEIITAAPTGRFAPSVWYQVYDSTGGHVCSGYAVTNGFEIGYCDLAAGQAYSLVVTGRGSSTEYRVTRKDASAEGATCRTPESTKVGGKATAGRIAGLDDIHCYRLTGTEQNSFWIGVRDDGAVGSLIVDAAGKMANCDIDGTPCRLTGSTEYRVFVWSPTTYQASDYLFDGWELGSPGRTPAECPVVADPTKAAPITAVLDDQDSARCLTVPVQGGTEFLVRVTNTEGGTDHPRLHLFNHTGTSSQTGGYCRQEDIGYRCALTLPRGVKEGTALLVFAPGTREGRFPFRAEFDCYPGPCASDPKPVTLTSVAPSTAPNSGPVTLTLTGSEFTAADTVRLTRAGSAAITATVTGVSEDRTRLTATASLTGVVAGGWDVTVGTAGKPGALTVTAAPLTLVRVPSISGTVRVGSTVKAVVGAFTPAASAYSYQWTANGAAISGAVASSYAIPASMRGKRLAVIVTGKLANRRNSPATSGASTVGYGLAAKATKKPRVTGTVKAGKKVRVSVGTWSPKATSYRYEWRVGGKLVARSSTLKIKKSWAGKKVTVTVIAKRTGHHDGRATSSSVKIKR